MSTDIDCIVVGAGVVGLAIARALALSGREVMVVEAAEGIGTGTSARTRTGREAGEAGDGAASDPATSLEERRAATRWVDQTVDTDTDTGTRVIGSCIQSSNAFNRTS